MPRWVYTNPYPRNIGAPFGLVKPGQIIEHPVKPYPDCFERIAEESEAQREDDAPKRRGRPPKETATATPIAHQRVEAEAPAADADEKADAEKVAAEEE